MQPKPSMTPAHDKAPTHAATIANSTSENVAGKQLGNIIKPHSLRGVIAKHGVVKLKVTLFKYHVSSIWCPYRLLLYTQTFSRIYSLL
jgi:hypothetical protein